MQLTSGLGMRLQYVYPGHVAYTWPGYETILRTPQAMWWPGYETTIRIPQAMWWPGYETTIHIPQAMWWPGHETTIRIPQAMWWPGYEEETSHAVEMAAVLTEASSSLNLVPRPPPRLYLAAR